MHNAQDEKNSADGQHEITVEDLREFSQASIAQSHAYGNPYAEALKAYTAETLAEEFNAFLKAKGLDSEYTVAITEENETA